MDRPLTLLRAMRAALKALAALPLEEVRTRAWRSAGFSGLRHEFALRFDGPHAAEAADGFVAGLGPAELEAPGHIVADVHVVSDERRHDWARLRIEVLTVKA
jgi:hypothetical protein